MKTNSCATHKVFVQTVGAFWLVSILLVGVIVARAETCGGVSSVEPTHLSVVRLIGSHVLIVNDPIKVNFLFPALNIRKILGVYCNGWPDARTLAGNHNGPTYLVKGVVGMRVVRILRKLGIYLPMEGNVGDSGGGLAGIRKVSLRMQHVPRSLGDLSTLRTYPRSFGFNRYIYRPFGFVRGKFGSYRLKSRLSGDYLAYANALIEVYQLEVGDSSVENYSDNSSPRNSEISVLVLMLACICGSLIVLYSLKC